MGTFGEYSGSMCISEDKKEAFSEQLMKLLNYGGMMELDKVKMYGKEILLLAPVQMNEKGEAYFHFNYFEDDAWESAGYEAKDTYFFSGKIGWKEFNNVVTAVHVLYELYDEGVGVAEINGDMVESSVYIGWINHVLGTQFSMKKRLRLWEHFEQYCLTREECGFPLWDIVPRSLFWALGGTEFVDICYIMNGTQTLRREEIAPHSYSEAVFRCREALERFFGSSAAADMANRGLREKYFGF